MINYAEIGRLGGLAGKGSPKKKQCASNAAKCRWAKHNRSKKRVILTLSNSGMVLDRCVPGLEQALSAFKYRRLEEGGLAASPISAYHEDSVALKPVIHPRLLHRVKDYLRQQGWIYQVVDKDVSLVRPERQENTTALSVRENRLLSRMLKSRFGAFAHLRGQRRQSFIVELVMAFRKFRGIVIATKIDEAKALRKALRLRLQAAIGLLAESSSEKENITVLTWNAVTQHIIAAEDCDFVIAANIPRNGDKSLAAVVSFTDSVRYGFIEQETRGTLRMLKAEITFGPFLKVP